MKMLWYWVAFAMSILFNALGNPAAGCAFLAAMLVMLFIKANYQE